MVRLAKSRAGGWRVANDKWEIVSSEYVVDSPWYRLRRDVCRLPDGTIVDPYYVREHAGFSVVFALTPSRDVVFVRQYKHGAGESVFELPAGGIDPGEDAERCARRELEEETGYRAPAFEQIAEFITDPTSSTGRLHLFLAREAAPDGRRSPDSTEDIETLLVPLHQVVEEVRAGRVRSQSQVAAVYTALDRLGAISVG